MRLGLDVFLHDYSSKFSDARIGLITNSTGVNCELRRNIDLFLEHGLKLVKLFGPEHGIYGAAPDGVKVSDAVDPRYKIPVYSLYGDKTRPTKEMLEDLDVVVFDIQDVGLRFYTYIYTMAYCMEESAKYGIKFIVLDRPNPINCEIVDGPVIKKDFDSFVGGYGLALRYGMTIGELARYLNDYQKVNADLMVIPMDGYARSYFYDETGLFWNTPSPNLPSLEHTLLYIGF
ncbi:MAG: exo-beta-N-acetylmuramidase NamZ domain-containing protein, partial [Pseudothermotoga sp.]